MRTSLGILLAITMFFVGVVAMSQAGQRVEEPVMNSSNDTVSAFNTTNDVFGGLATVTGESLAWMGVGAIVVVALGVLVYAGNQGGR